MSQKVSQGARKSRNILVKVIQEESGELLMSQGCWKGESKDCDQWVDGKEKEKWRDKVMMFSGGKLQAAGSLTMFSQLLQHCTLLQCSTEQYKMQSKYGMKEFRIELEGVFFYLWI